MQLGGERILKISSHLPKLWYFISRDTATVHCGRC